ncbi:MAG: dipeptidase [Candidatus Odinarchaeota archaeon]
MVIDAHADTLLKRYLGETISFLSGAKIDYHISEELLRKGGIDVQVFAIWVPVQMENFALDITLKMVAKAKTLAEQESFVLIKSKNDLKKIENQNDTLGMVLSIEGAVVLDRNLDLLPLFHELGIRSVGLAWSRSNLFAEGVTFKSDSSPGRGLSPLGKELVQQLEATGMLVDVSHLNPAGFNDVVNLSTKPFIASHSNARYLCSSIRNLTDEQLMDVASAGGVVGINFCSSFLNDKPEEASINDVIMHIEHIADVASIDSVGLGSDFDGITKGPAGLEDAGQVSKLPRLLEEHGFSKPEISKIMGRNFQRVFEKIWK